LIYKRHFTREEANRLLPRVQEALERLRSARDRLTDPASHEALAEAAPANGGGQPGRAVGEAFLELRALLGELETEGVVVRDLDRGLVDFPALMEGREVFLCWEAGEDEVSHWHELEEGYRGRQPLD